MLKEQGAIPPDFLYSKKEDSAELSFYLDQRFPDLELHFPNIQLVAGYYQLIWLEFLVKKTFPDFYVSEIVDLKFKGMIQSPNDVLINLSWNKGVEVSEQSIQFSIISEEEKVKTVGKVLLVKSFRVGLLSAKGSTGS